MAGLVQRWLSAPVRAVVWTLDVCDAQGAPSLAKGIALVCAGAVIRDMWLRGVGVQNTAAMALVLSAAFGRSVFMQWLSRQTTTTTNAVTVDAAALAKVVLERRDAARGVEAT